MPQGRGAQGHRRHVDVSDDVQARKSTNRVSTSARLTMKSKRLSVPILDCKTHGNKDNLCRHGEQGEEM